MFDEGGWWEGEVVAVLAGEPGAGAAAAGSGNPDTLSPGAATVRLVDGEREVPLADVRGSAAWAPGDAWRLLGDGQMRCLRRLVVKPWHHRLYDLRPEPSRMHASPSCTVESASTRLFSSTH